MTQVNMRELEEQVQQNAAFCTRLTEEIARTVIGQKNMVQKMLVGMLADGHILLEGLPGLAKTTAVKAFSDAVSLDFKRIQFTPDLLPADLLGTQIYNARESVFEIKKGPLFTNLVLADEINRAPSKVQTALLEAMQEKQITIGGEKFKLSDPFLVLATQNPLEQEGTYPLPEAQVDRFMLKVKVEYPLPDEEKQILDAVSGGGFESVRPVVQPDELLKGRETVRKIYMDERIRDYIIAIVAATRNPEAVGLDELSSLIEVGGSPRASINLASASKAHAFINGRAYVTPEDIKAIGMDVLRHRVILSYEAEAEEVVSEDVVQKIFDTVEVP